MAILAESNRIDANSSIVRLPGQFALEQIVENISLVQDLVRWVAQKPRTYRDVLDAWRTSCPRLTIWEDAVDAGLVDVSYDNAAIRVVSVTDQGRQFLADTRTSPRVGKPLPPGS